MDLLDTCSHMEHPPLTVVMTAYGSVDSAVEATSEGPSTSSRNLSI
jgi:hypothetical protein